MLEIPVVVGFYSIIKLIHSILKRTCKNSLETRSFSETSRFRDETETLHLRDRGFEKSCLETVSRPRHVSRQYSSGPN